MPRVARIKFEGEGVYHLYNRIACHKGDYPFEQNQAEAKRKFVEILRFYSNAHCCEILAFTVMGNHFHFIAHFRDYRNLTRAELEERVPLFYPNTASQANIWSDEQWERFNQRIFDVSELMRSVQSAFARWYNKRYERKGRLWADRYKSTVLLDNQAVLDCMHYIELNAMRAGIAPNDRPEDFPWCSLHYREIGQGDWLSPLKEVLGEDYETSAIKTYKAQIYHRGGVPTENQSKTIPQKLILREEKRDFAPRGVFSKKMRFFSDGLAIGTKEAVSVWLDRFKLVAGLKRDSQPRDAIEGGIFYLRDQRSNFRDI